MPSPNADVLRVVVGLSLALTLAALATLPSVRRLERRLGFTVLVSSGLPFLALGYFFRHPAVGVLTDAVMSDLRPALEFGFGWLGFLVGLQFDVRELDNHPEHTGTVVVIETVVPVVTTTVACVAALIGLDARWSFADLLDDRTGAFAVARSVGLRDALALGAAAAQAAPVAGAVVARMSSMAGERMIEVVTRLDDVAGVAVLAFVCAFFRPADVYAAWKLPHIAWVFVTLGLGGVLGIVTYLLVRSARGPAEETAYLLGAIALSAGMSGYLAISPMVTGAIAGALFANLPLRAGDRVRVLVTQLERPLYLVFLLIAGAMWDPLAWQGWVLAPVFVLARVGGKLVAAHAAKRVAPNELPDATTLGLALAPQSPFAIVTVVSYVTLYRPHADVNGALPWLVTACVGGGILTELVVQAITHARARLHPETA